MGDLDFRTRERIVLFVGAAALSYLGLAAIAQIAGRPIGNAGDKLGSWLILFYLCARIAAHAKTLEERGMNERLARVAWLASPLMLLVLLLQATKTGAPQISFVGLQPVAHIGLWPRIEWSADIALFALFLVTSMAVWLDRSQGVSASVTRISYVVVGLLSLGLLGIVWGAVGLVAHVRLLASLFVLSVVGWLLVAILRRIERLDEEEPGGPPPLPVAPLVPVAAQSLKPQA